MLGYSNRKARQCRNPAPAGLLGGALALCMLVLAALAHCGSASAANPSAMASQLSDQAFALLNSLNKQSNGGSTNPLLPQVATFAGDAQTLSDALAKGDGAAA